MHTSLMHASDYVHVGFMCPSLELSPGVLRRFLRSTQIRFRHRHPESEPKHKTPQIRFHQPQVGGSGEVDASNTTVDTTESPTSPKFQVKWDSERKRRQGYFAQDGTVKSKFRHYNKSDCQ